MGDARVPNTAQIKALVSLLGDDDPRVGGLIWENLARLGPDAIPALREACEDPDPRLRLRARHALDQLAYDQIEFDLRLIAEKAEEPFDLEGALYALARLEDPELTRERLTRPLDQLATRIGERAGALRHPLDRIGGMNAVLYGELRMTPVLRSQADLKDFSLARVLERRVGAPVILAAAFLLEADRLGLELGIVSLPSHVLLTVDGGGEEVYIDPSRGGRVLTRRECVQTYLRDYHPRETYIHPSGRRDLVIRVVRGMMLLCARTQDRLRSRRLGRILEILRTRERSR